MSFYVIDNGMVRPLSMYSPSSIFPQRICNYRQQDLATRRKEEALEKLFENQETFDKDKLLSDLRELASLVNENIFNQGSEIQTRRDQEAEALASGQTKTELIGLTKEGKDFQVQINAKNFNPEKIQVRIRHGFVTVEAREEEIDDKEGTYQYRQLRRRFRLPQGVDPDTITCEMNDQGVMTIKAPAKDAPKPEERNVPIEMKGSAKQPVEEKKGGESKDN